MSVPEAPPPSRRPVLVVLSADGRRPKGLEALERTMTVRDTDEAGLGDALEGADALFLWDFGPGGLERAWHRADRLSWVHVAAAGVDHVLFDRLVDSSVTVTNARGVFDGPMAEFALMSVLAHAKQAHTSRRLQEQQEWRPRLTSAVAGSHALVVGTGSIGRATARLMSGVGMQVRGAGRSARAHDPDFGTVLASAHLPEHVGWADYVIVLTPLTPQTRGLIDRSVLQAMKPSAYLVNLGRGLCVVQDDLVAALEQGEIAGAALDVVDPEPLPPGHPLWTAPGVTLSPHMSGDVPGRQEELVRRFVQNAQRFVEGQPLADVVDKHLGFAAAGTAR